MGSCPINETQVQWNTPGFSHSYGWAPSVVLKNIGPRITLEDNMCIYSITRTHTLSVWGQERIGRSQEWKQWAEHCWLTYKRHKAGNRAKAHCYLIATDFERWHVTSSKPAASVRCKTLNLLQLLLGCNPSSSKNVYTGTILVQKVYMWGFPHALTLTKKTTQFQNGTGCHNPL